MAKAIMTLLDGELLDEHIELSFAELCRSCALSAEELLELVEQGVIVPKGRDSRTWRFQAICIQRVKCATRLRKDLGVNVAGVALALELLDELQELRQRLEKQAR